MKKGIPSWLLLVFDWGLVQFTDQFSLKKIEALENRFQQTKQLGAADSLITLYREYVQKHPKESARNFNYLVKAADLQFQQKDDAVNAVKWTHEALEKYQEPGVGLAEPIGVLARIWAAYIYKAAPAVRLDPDDIDKTRAVLMKNQVWIDSNLVRLEKGMSGANGTVNKNLATDFIGISEAYATLVQQDQPDKYADLLMKSAALAKTVENPNKAIQLY